MFGPCRTRFPVCPSGRNVHSPLVGSIAIVAHLLVGQALANRSGSRRAGPATRTGARALGEAVALAQFDPGARGKRVAHGGREWRGADDRELQACDVGVDGDLREQLVDGRYGRHRGDAVVLYELPERTEE